MTPRDIADEVEGNTGRKHWNDRQPDSEAKAMLAGAIKTIDKLLNELKGTLSR